jgi:Zn-dependent protease with chaperone function
LTQAQFEALVHRLEVFSQKHPAQYRFRVGFVAAIGYGYILAIFVIAIVLFCGSISSFVAFVSSAKHLSAGAIKILLVVVAFLFVVITAIFKAIWDALTTKIPTPMGLALNPKQVPELAKLIDRLSQEIGINNLKRILVVPEYTASVVQIPQFGVFGSVHNYLVIGLPLLQSLTPSQFIAVLAHEFGHLSENHGKFGAWIYRLSGAYSKLLAQTEQNQRGGSILSIFLYWYVPFLNAYSFVLRRRNEYIADSFAVKVTGASSTAHALILSDIYALGINEKFWPEVYGLVKTVAEPPQNIFDRLETFLKDGLEVVTATELLDRCLAEKTSYHDTHPSLHDRLSAIGYLNTTYTQAKLPPLTEKNAAKKFLGTARESIVQQVNEVWYQSVLPSWQERNTYIQTANEGLVTLEQKAQDDGLTADETLQLACWTAEFKEINDGIYILESGIEKYPDRSDFYYSLGLIFLDDSQFQSALAKFEIAMELNPNYIIPICEKLYVLAQRTDSKQLAQQCLETIDRYGNSLTAARQERMNLTERDEIEVHDFSAEIISVLVDRLLQFPDIRTAYLVRKSVKNFENIPHYFLIVVYQYPWHKLSSSPQDAPILHQKICDAIELPADYTLLLGRKGNLENQAGIVRKLQKMPRTIVFDRQRQLVKN